MKSGYLEAVRGILEFLEERQAAAIETAAGLVVDAVGTGGCVFCSDIGHGLQHDFLDRAGGLALVRPFSFAFNLNNPVAECRNDREAEGAVPLKLETVDLAVRHGNLRAGDVMIVGSVSGRNAVPVELALACRRIGAKVIGLTSMEYTRRVESLHPSGKRLFEVADVVIDNGAPYGDAAVDLPGLEIKALPVSGVATLAAGWMLWEKVAAGLLETGRQTTVYMSINREGGEEYYQCCLREFHERGY